MVDKTSPSGGANRRLYVCPNGCQENRRVFTAREMRLHLEVNDGWAQGPIEAWVKTHSAGAKPRFGVRTEAGVLIANNVSLRGAMFAVALALDRGEDAEIVEASA